MSNRQARREQSRTTPRTSRPKTPQPGKTPRKPGGGPDLLSLPFLAGATILIVVLAVVLGVLVSRGGSSSSSDTALVSAIQTSTAALPKDLMNGTKLGKDTAKIKLTEYEDFQCPFCLRYTAEQEPTLIKEYVATGKMQIIYMNYPIIGAESVKAAQAGLCAAAQNLFWPYHDKLFLVEAQAGQATTEQRDVGRFSDANLKLYAKDVGLDTTKFNTCFDSGTYANQVSTEYSDGRAFGISGTPGFLINGTPIGTGTPASIAAWRTALDKIYNATEVPTPAPSPEALQIKEAAWFISASSAGTTYLRWVAVIVNPNVGYFGSFPTLTVTAVDAAGKVVGTKDQVLFDIPPGATIAFGGLMTTVGAAPSRLRINPSNVRWSSTTARPEMFPAFGVTPDQSVVDNFGQSTITGSISNPYPVPVESLAVTALYRDAAGKLVGGDTTFVNNLPASGTKAFEISGRVPPFTKSEVIVIPWSSSTVWERIAGVR